MLEVGRKILRNSLDGIASGCYSATIYTIVFNTSKTVAETMDNRELSYKETLSQCGKSIMVPSIMLTTGLVFQGISKLV